MRQVDARADDERREAGNEAGDAWSTSVSPDGGEGRSGGGGAERREREEERKRTGRMASGGPGRRLAGSWVRVFRCQRAPGRVWVSTRIIRTECVPRVQRRPPMALRMLDSAPVPSPLLHISSARLWERPLAATIHTPGGLAKAESKSSRSVSNHTSRPPSPPPPDRTAGLQPSQPDCRIIPVIGRD